MSSAFFKHTPESALTDNFPKFPSEGKNYTVYIPQGKAGRLDRNSISLGFDGLYTEGISTCNILITLTKNIIELAHIDYITAAHLENLIGSMENLSDPACEIILIARENLGQLIEPKLIQYLQEFLGKTVALYRMTTENGARVSFDKNTSNIFHPQIKFYTFENQTEIHFLHHPQEQEFLAIQKIEQIIGLIEIKLSGLRPPKKVFIFDKKFWQMIDERELTIENSHPLTQEELNYFSNSDTLIDITNKIFGLANLAEKFGIPTAKHNLENIGSDIAFYLEGYLNQYNPQVLYKRNMLDFFDFYSAETSEDIAFKSKALTCLKSSENPFSEYNELLNMYAKTTGSSEFKRLVLGSVTFPDHYKRRLVEQERAQTRITEIQLAQTHYTTAKQNYDAGNYNAANTLALEALKTFSYHCTNDSPKLRNVYALLGYCLFKSKDFAQAKLFLEVAISLMQPNQKGYSKEKYQTLINTLQTCEENLEVTDSTQVLMNAQFFNPTPTR